ncbi:TROVE domain-containing protein [Actinomadura sp. KC216]|uniref:TROVE domain-containing protein n=1 Tax=Actinomadura sp. KC216 TaxID=2530370 RepID=UPI001048DC0C|nr:TROVE domain-containing protein [Actinomadura sp. KC216]TDB73693.1 TROVE domain-containing protein [Actinomadura sp. KC216]
MAKYNRAAVRAATASAIRAETSPSGRTYEGAPGYARDAKSELFLLAVANMVGEDTFYESAGDRDARFRDLVRRVAVEDGAWTAGFLPWLRGEANMRSAPVVAALEAVRARLAAGRHGRNRQMVADVLRRADEPGEALAYWTSTYGRAVPKPVKRGIADAVRRLYTERSLLKYDTAAHGFRFGDVIDLVHPAPAADKPWQGELFAHALDRRHGRGTDVPERLATLRARAALMATPAAERRAVLLADGGPERLRAAGITWEALAGWLQGPMDAAAWEAIIPGMGVMALARNLRNFDRAGVSDEAAGAVAATLADPGVIARSRMFPFRFLAAHRAAPSLRWAWPLERALNHSLANVPALTGRTLILVDRSGSMFGRVSNRSGLNRADSAAIFGTALAMRADAADLVEFGTGHRTVPVRRGESLLTVLDRFGNLGGTDTAQAVRATFRGHDRVVIVTDEQAWGGHRGADPADRVPGRVPVYTWNLAGYRYGHGPSGADGRHVFGGLSDAAFQLIPLLESGRDAAWPWRQTG